MPRLYTLVSHRSPAWRPDDLRPEDIDIVFVNTVTGREVEAQRVAAHDVGDTSSSWQRASALPPDTRGRGVAGGATRTWISTRLPPASCGCAVVRIACRNTSSCRVGYNLSESKPAPTLNLAPALYCWCEAACDISGIRGPAGDDSTDRARAAVRGGGRRRRGLRAHRGHPWLELSGGSDAWLEGAQFSGALSIHYQDRVSVSHTTIRDNQGADGLSIKYAAGAVTDSSFTGNRDDQVDFEYFDGIVRDSRFESAPSGDSNGDGLDLRGSRVFVVNNDLTGAADKAASVGEESEALFVSNRFGHSAIGGGGQGPLDGLPV